MGNWSRLWLLSASLLIFWVGSGAMQAAKLDPGAWKIYPLILPPPPSGVWVTNQLSLPSGTNPVAPGSPNLLTNLTDNNPSTLVTLSNSIGLFIDLGQTNVVDRIFIIGGNHTNLNLWSNNLQNQSNPPLGLIVVSIGNHGPMMKQVGTWTVPYDAGNPVDTEVDLRFSPAAGRYVQIQLQTNVTWGVNYWPGYALASQPAAPTNLTWNVGEVELYGFRGPMTNLNAVVCDSTNQPLQIAALDLSYYLGELTGLPHPIITSSQTNLYPGRIYRIADLASLAPDYNTMMANIASGALPTNLVVSVVGREVQFSGWPYRCVDWGVWEFLERQGVRWVYPDGHGDFVPTGSGVSLSMLPLKVSPSAISIYANFDCSSLHPWPNGMLQSVRQEYLYPWRNRWNASYNTGPIGGAEIPALPSPGGTVNSNYAEGFVGYPENFSSVVPTRILDTYTNWWGWTNTTAGSAVESQSNPTFIFDDPTLISWVANKMTNIAAVNPLACSYPLNILHWHRSYNLLPIDASIYSQDPYTMASNGPVQLNPMPWVKLYNNAYSGAYYSFVTAVANQVRQKGSSALVGALAYADVFPPPTNITTFPTNVQVEVCLYGAPNLPMSAPANAGMKAALDGWHATCSRLATYGYALLHADIGRRHRLPVPLVAGTVGHAQYLRQHRGAGWWLPGKLGFSPIQSVEFLRLAANPMEYKSNRQPVGNGIFQWVFPRSRRAHAGLLSEFGKLPGHQRYKHALHQAIAYGITPGSFPLSVLYAMQTNLARGIIAGNQLVCD